ncbi:CDP-diacylglycerol--serine O-phosphatidyltransferase [Halorhodospira halochloris]|uniref:CDP-diacylglycerol--serine O-phosphatidyltransferase n=1 Tax=Halorhodospira halochloris TaxID=1052 RepID=UPI001EE8404C|nr:CDP-diacylglycerol--serine O-phosphatidyltransferase [Halorhodospira halochloris]MCG5530995.1 CDP-diacylglycerol--serine O-phosphatidyltransferase [Halorhodospira halochloris]MCG5548776.1 CDP-diacylglycerol--serine O-phosphatidyltransferase [Halorhodospira halochloris]
MINRRRRGIYLLPNLLTTGCVFFGFLGIILGMDGDFGLAAIAVLVAMLFDGLDGRVARITGTDTDFGVQYDSLADMVSFGLAPSLIVYNWALGDNVTVLLWDNGGWLAAFLFVACAALRLARFNTQSGVSDKSYFQGLPSPAAAGVVVTLVWFGERVGLSGYEAAIPAAIITIAAAAMMVSNIRYDSFKELDIRYRVRFPAIVGLVVALILIAVHPPTALFLGFLAYLLSGPVLTIVRLRRHRWERRG